MGTLPGFRAIISACFIVVSVAQLVELWIVAPAVAGSNPVAHPKFFLNVDAASRRVYSLI
jgi:hypothetical protein